MGKWIFIRLSEDYRLNCTDSSLNTQTKKQNKASHCWVQQRHSCARLMVILENLHLRSDTSCLNTKNQTQRVWAGGEQHGAKCRVVGSWCGMVTVCINTHLSDSLQIKMNEEIIKSQHADFGKHFPSVVLYIFFTQHFYCRSRASLSSDLCSHLLLSMSMAKAWRFLCRGARADWLLADRGRSLTCTSFASIARVAL